MEFKEISGLLEKYWKCETTVREEQLLTEYFDRDDIPIGLQPYSAMFRYFKKVSDMKPDSAFNPEEIINKSLINESDSSGQIKKRVALIFKVAAGVLLILSVVFAFERMKLGREISTSISKDTFNNPIEALIETKKVLYLVSLKLKIGEGQAEKISKFHKAESVIKNAK